MSRTGVIHCLFIVVRFRHWWSLNQSWKIWISSNAYRPYWWTAFHIKCRIVLAEWVSASLYSWDTLFLILTRKHVYTCAVFMVYPSFHSDVVTMLWSLTLWHLTTCELYRTANLQTLHFIYLFNKCRYWIF